MSGFADAAHAQHVQSLDEIPATLESAEARQVWQREMQGRVSPDLLGEARLAGLDHAELLQIFAPDTEHGHVSQLGAKVWPQQPDRYVAIACVNAVAPRYDHRSSCDGDDRQVYPAVLEKRGAQLHRVAELGLFFTDNSLVAPDLYWSGDAGLELPQKLEEVDEDHMPTGHPYVRNAVPDQWDEFDFARNELSNGGYAFVLRGSWSEGYAGGGASWSALYLFEVKNGALSLVFGAPMSMLKNLAGDWNEEGTRQYDIAQASNVLVVLPATHHGYHDLQVRTRGYKTGDTYRWSPEFMRYQLAR